MNTDNMLLSGQTIDTALAFVDGYKADAKFSAIDSQGRYRLSISLVSHTGIAVPASCS